MPSHYDNIRFLFSLNYFYDSSNFSCAQKEKAIIQNENWCFCSIMIHSHALRDRSNEDFHIVIEKGNLIFQGKNWTNFWSFIFQLVYVPDIFSHVKSFLNNQMIDKIDWKIDKMIEKLDKNQVKKVNIFRIKWPFSLRKNVMNICSWKKWKLFQKIFPLFSIPKHPKKLKVSGGLFIP